MAKESLKSRGKTRRCRICEKRQPDAGKRGCCSTCYMTAYRHVKRGDYTWEQLQQLGLISPPSRKRPPSVVDHAVAAKQTGAA